MGGHLEKQWSFVNLRFVVHHRSGSFSQVSANDKQKPFSKNQ